MRHISYKVLLVEQIKRIGRAGRAPHVCVSREVEQSFRWGNKKEISHLPAIIIDGRII